VVIISLALLERYLRQKRGIGEVTSLPDEFFDEFCELFPKIPDIPVARQFWRVCRHGLMHQAAFNVTTVGGQIVSEVGVDD
jgi:hypothetical protein